ncbi:MAG: PKD-like domain-containing protein, partial [Bacteroidales bacterium]|nr:PKD-like domain-containing protein [Bacteroidales bacterium]
INPTPRILPLPEDIIQCDSTYTNIVLESPSVFTGGLVSFRYEAEASGVAGDVTGFLATESGLSDGYVINRQLINHTDEPQTVTWIITPESGVACNDGPSDTVTVVINPTPRILPLPEEIIQCDSTYTNIILESPSTFTDGLVSFRYEAEASGVAGDVTGFLATESGLSDGYVINRQLINHTDEPQTVTWIITPESGVICKDGPSDTVTVVINPTPRILPLPEEIIQCDSTYTNIVLESPSTFTDGLVSFRYEAEASGVAGDVTGFLATESGLDDGYVISQRLINHTDEPQTVTWIVTPESGVACNDGPSDTVTVVINPTPRILPLPEEIIQCDSTYTNIVLESPSIFTGGTVSFRYEAEASGVAGDVTGFLATESGLDDGYVISQRLINHTDEPQTVTWIVTPESGVACNDGPSDTVTVVINPTPRIFPVPIDRVQCDSTFTDIQLISPSIFTNGLVTFRYQALASGSAGDITGFTSFDTDLANGYTISQRLINHTDEPQTVTYIVTPVSGVLCNDGPSKTIIVTIDPTPRAVPVNVDPDICYDEFTEIRLESPSVMTTGGIIYDYSISMTGVPGYITGNGLPATGVAEGEVLSFSYRNDYDSVLSVKYSIIPKGINSVCNPGPAAEVEVRVHPKPARDIIITQPFTCKTSASERGALRAIVGKGAEPLEIVWDGPLTYHVEGETDISNLDWGKYILEVTDNAGCSNRDSIQILPNLPTTRIFATPLIPNVHISCPGASDGTIDIYVPSGSTAPYEFRLVQNDTIEIDSGIFTGNYDPMNPDTYRRYYKMLGAGTYTLTIRDNNYCEVIKTTELNEPEPIVAQYEMSDYNGYSVSCRNYNNGFIRINSVTGGSGTYQFQWATESGPVQADPSGMLLESAGAGDYFVTITDVVLNCSVTDTITLTEPDGMNLESFILSESEDENYNIPCSGGNDGSIALTITGGSGIYTYLWNGPEGFTSEEKDISGLSAGPYVITVTDLNGCTLLLPETHEKPEFILTEPELLDFAYNLPQSADGAFNIDCSGGTGSVGVSVTGGSTGNYSYTWTTEDGSGIIQGVEDQPGLGAGIYTLRVSDLNGCETEKTFTLTSPLPLMLELTPTHITCNSPGFDDGSVDLSVSGGIAPYTYLWSNGDITEDISGLTQGTYSVVITDANGCEATAGVIVTDPPPLSFDADVSDYNGFNISCYGLSDGSIDITMSSGTQPYSFTWLMPDGSVRTTSSISGLAAGQYTLHIEDINSCIADT